MLGAFLNLSMHQLGSALRGYFFPVVCWKSFVVAKQSLPQVQAADGEVFEFLSFQAACSERNNAGAV